MTVAPDRNRRTRAELRGGSLRRQRRRVPPRLVQSIPRSAAMPRRTVVTRSRESRRPDCGISSSSASRWGSSWSGWLATTASWAARSERPTRRRALAGGHHRRAQGHGGDHLVGGVGVQDGEPLPHQHAEDPVDVGGDRLHRDRPFEVLREQRGLRQEDVVVVGRPLVQPHRPVLAGVLRDRARVAAEYSAASRIRSSLPDTWWYSAAMRHVEVVGDGPQREPVEPELVGGLGDHLPADPGRPSDLRAARHPLGSAPPWAARYPDADASRRVCYTLSKTCGARGVADDRHDRRRRAGRARGHRA